MEIIRRAWNRSKQGTFGSSLVVRFGTPRAEVLSLLPLAGYVTSPPNRVKKGPCFKGSFEVEQ